MTGKPDLKALVEFDHYSEKTMDLSVVINYVALVVMTVQFLTFMPATLALVSGLILLRGKSLIKGLDSRNAQKSQHPQTGRYFDLHIGCCVQYGYHVQGADHLCDIHDDMDGTYK